MAYWTHTKDTIGAFVEKDRGNTFEYSTNDERAPWCDFPHKVWVGGTVNDQGYRYATVKKTVVYVAVDEDERGQPVVEKWNIRGHREYVV